jgi:hypothetical protein
MPTTTSAENKSTIVVLVAMECPAKKCGVIYGLSAEFHRQRQADHDSWRCPNGHTLWYPKPERTEADQLRDQLEASRQVANSVRESYRLQARATQAARRSAAAHKGWATRIRNAIADGRCPCCHQTFPDVRAHIATNHPSFHQDLTEPTDG